MSVNIGITTYTLVVRADRFNDARSTGTGARLYDLGFFDDVQDIGQVFAVAEPVVSNIVNRKRHH
jgi:hypothetical protein